MELETPSGPGRLDAIHRGGNAILAAPLKDKGNYALNTSPVRYPAIWDTPYLDWVLYDASIRQPLARNIVEALGVGAPLDPQTMLSNNVVHGVLMDNIVQVHRALKQLKSPRWPDSIPIDAAKVARGSTVYREQHCVTCHAVIDRQSHLPSDYSQGDPDPIKVVMVPLDKILTDPRQAVTLATRFVSLKNVGGSDHIPYTKAVRTVTGAIVDQWKSKSNENAADEQDVNGGRLDEIRAPLAYRARPLNGIWATAPYLHNGSVPSLHALLLAPADRPANFCTGGWDFDPVNVGRKADGPCDASLQFKPLRPGNSNAGHEYGTDLSESDRMALIEYLKTL
jgi:hypothetical protein